MPESNTDFTYLSVLRELEKEVAQLAGKSPGKVEASFTHTKNWFKGTVGGLLSFATARIANGSKDIAKALGVKEQAIKRSEEARLRHLSAWTQSHTRYEVGKATTWPPLIPIGLTVERFIGTTIGLHSESPNEPFERHVHSSLSDTVAPALAWGLWCQLRLTSEDCRSNTAEAVKASIMNPATEFRDPARLTIRGVLQQTVEIPYLRLLHGWLVILQQRKAEWALTAETLRSFRLEVMRQFDRYCEDPKAGISELLLTHYGTTDHGSERARVVAMVHHRSPNSAAFLRGRLSLLSGANLPELAHFKHLLGTNPSLALADAEKLLASDKARPENHGELACGRAYWLARYTYGRHDSPGVVESDASSLTLRLLQSAAKSFADDDEKRTYCLRFAAGYATNPRYFRSELVLQRQNECISEYVREPLHRPKVAEMFKARVAWQCQASSKGLKNRHLAKEAARHYNLALEGAAASAKGLDSEAPVHLFPELYVFLKEFSDPSSAGSKKVLAVIDHVVQHNYGIYFDAEVEERLIKAGISQFRELHERNHGDTSPQDALKIMAASKGEGDHQVREILERKVRASNAARPTDPDEA